MDDDIYNQYASIDEVKDKLLETGIMTAAALNGENEKPPLPPNHPKLVAKAKACECQLISINVALLLAVIST